MKQKTIQDGVWVTLKRDYCVGFWQQRIRRKGGALPPLRFLLLGPLANPRELRATVAAGDIVDGQAVLDHGLVTDELRAEIEAAAAARP